MDKVVIVKKVISTVVGLGTSTIVKAIIENNTEPETLTSKVTVTAASAAIGYAASDVMSDYTDAKIDEVINWWKNRSNKETE